MKQLASLLSMLCVLCAQGQNISNTLCTSPLAEQVLKGLYDPTDFAATTVIGDHAVILCDLRTRVSSDSLESNLRKLEAFHTRHAYSDTLSVTTGIGAARRWAYSKFQEASIANDNRLIPAFLQFDYVDPVCGPASGWRDVFAVLPGDDTTNKSIVLIEAHLDSRCADNCDPICAAPGAEDNGSGSALVLELARVLSRYTFHHTIVFMLTTGEEQGLVGATAMAQYCVDQGIAIKGVQNNDIVGGIICGNTSSAPSCPGPGDIDSLQVRLFSEGSIGQPHRAFARTIKMFYQEKMQAQVPVPMTISIINQEDRTNRGGDHIPFRERGFRNVRFTAANEDGDASVDSAWYNDRQHTSGDILGVDTDGDLVVDSLYVDFHYLQRNAVINGLTATLLALGPETPTSIVHADPGGIRVSITSGFNLAAYRIGVRNASSSSYFDAVYRTTDTSFTVPGLTAGHGYFISVAGIDSATIMSPFSNEVVRLNHAETPAGTVDPLPFGINCVPIGIADPIAHASTLIIAPNPATTAITLISDAPSARSVLLLDPLGRVVRRAAFDPQRELDVSMLSPSCYIVVLLNAQGAPLGRARFVKE